MIGANDGGKYIEALRTEHMKKGMCGLRATGCEGYSERLEFHHESYNPERGIYVCHHCHHLAHFRPYHLTGRQKEKLLRVRYGDRRFYDLAAKKGWLEKARIGFVPPGRRPAQMKVRAEVRRRAREK